MHVKTHGVLLWLLLCRDSLNACREWFSKIRKSNQGVLSIGYFNLHTHGKAIVERERERERERGGEGEGEEGKEGEGKGKGERGRS